MRKILTIALVALMAASLFAGVTTKGYVQGAAHFTKEDGSDAVLFAEDSDNKAQVSITDENKVWGTTLNAQKQVFKTNTWVDVMKLAKVDSDFAAKIVVLTGDRLATLTAYKNNADENNYWRLRNDFNFSKVGGPSGEGTSINAQIGYGKYVSAQAGFQIWQGPITKVNREDKTSFVTSILVTPIDGVKASAGYLIYDFDSKKDAFVVAGDVDVAKLAGLDFTFGAGIAYRKYDKFATGAKISNNQVVEVYTTGNDDGILTAQVYGEYAGVNAYAEMTFLDAKELKLGAAYQFCDAADAGAYVFFGAYNDTDFDKNVKIGVEGNYKVAKNISLYGNIEWAAKNFDAEARCKVTF